MTKARELSEVASAVVVDGRTTEAMRIDSSGNLLVGTTDNSPAANNVSGFSVQPSGLIQASRSSYISAIFNRKTDDGDIAQFRKDGTTVGSIGTAGGAPYFGGTARSLRIGSGGFYPASGSGAYGDANMDIGASNVRFKDLYLSGGVYLGGTGAANKLDDYETGTWTPVISVGTATFANARYVKIGELVTVYVNIADISDYTTNSGIAVTGLPFTASSINYAVGASMFRYFNASGKAQMNAYIGGNTTQLEFYWSSDSNANWANVKYADGGQSYMDITCSISYRTTS